MADLSLDKEMLQYVVGKKALGPLSPADRLGTFTSALLGSFHPALTLVALRIAAVLGAAVGQDAQGPDVVGIEERDHPVVEQLGRADRRLTVVELGERHLRVGVDEGLLVDPPDPLEDAHVERVLGAVVARMLALEESMHRLRIQRLEPLVHVLQVVALPDPAHPGRRHRAPTPMECVRYPQLAPNRLLDRAARRRHLRRGRSRVLNRPAAGAGNRRPRPTPRPSEEPVFGPDADPDFAAVVAALADEYQANNDRGRRFLIARFWALFPELRGGVARREVGRLARRWGSELLQREHRQPSGARKAEVLEFSAVVGRADLCAPDGRGNGGEADGEGRGRQCRSPRTPSSSGGWCGRRGRWCRGPAWSGSGRARTHPAPFATEPSGSHVVAVRLSGLHLHDSVHNSGTSGSASLGTRGRACRCVYNAYLCCTLVKYG